MNRTPETKAFTAVELVVIAAFIALLASVTLPSLHVLEKRQMGSVCLSNLQQIGTASLAYAFEDPYEQAVPLHMMNIRSDATAYISSGPWCWRTALPFSFGGRTAIRPMQCGSYNATALMIEERWGASTRPLNQYVADLESFHCPADTGFPEYDPFDWDGTGNLGAPNDMANIPCWDFLGNSYRNNSIGLIWTNYGSANWKGMFDSGPKGQMASSIEEPSNTPLYIEPLFYWWTRQNPDYWPNPSVLEFPGWHGEITTDNVAYCDGSARMVQVYPRIEFTYNELNDMDFCHQFSGNPEYFLRRGNNWQSDCYPSPGALIQVFRENCSSKMPASALDDYDGWPFDGYTENECPW